jgi:FixJ family two-component response regulator
LAGDLIAVIDDDESVRSSMKLLIRSFGYRVAVFQSAEEFLSSGQLKEASCLIVDLQMSGMSGLQLQGHLAAARHRIPIIFMSAITEQEPRRRAMQAGAVAFLTKPYSDELILRSIQSALRDNKSESTHP